MSQDGLWDLAPERRPGVGEVRRALDRDIRAAEAEGKSFRETDKASLRRQANDLDRLEHLLAAAPEAKTWDYQPKTAAHVAYAAAVRTFFGEDGADDDPFARAVEDLRAAALRDTANPEPAD